MRLFCVRHGETFHNLQGRIQGQSDSQLSPLGLRQFERVAELFASHEIDAVIASPLSRARRSAELVAQRLKLEV